MDIYLLQNPKYFKIFCIYHDIFLRLHSLDDSMWDTTLLFAVTTLIYVFAQNKID